MYPNEGWTPEDVFVGSEIMSYDKWNIEVVSMGPAQIPSEIQLGDYTIRCPDGEYLFVYNGKNFFCDIRYAFAEGFINKNDVYDIGWLYDPTFLERYPKEKGRIEPELSNRIRQDFLKYKDYPRYELVDIDIKKYYGTFHGCNVVSMMPAEIRIPEIDPTEIAGYMLYDEDMYAYKNGTFLPLKEAYNTGWLTKQDIQELYKIGFAE